MRSIKTADGWKLIEYDVLDGEIRETQMFNLNENPNEFLTGHHVEKLMQLLNITPTDQQIDLAERPEFASKRKELETLLKSEMERLGDPYTLSVSRK
jgi:hypothetical protein